MKTGSVRDGVPDLIYDPLFCVRARCIIRELSYQQRINQLRRRRLRSYLTRYSATVLPGRCFSGVSERCQCFTACSPLLCFTLFMLRTVYVFYGKRCSKRPEPITPLSHRTETPLFTHRYTPLPRYTPFTVLRQPAQRPLCGGGHGSNNIKRCGNGV